MHNGLDLKVNIGDTIVAAFDGKVRIVKYERRGYGKYVVIRHDNGLETVYGHLSKQLVEENQLVKAGEVIGLGGNTGRSTGSDINLQVKTVVHSSPTGTERRSYLCTRSRHMESGQVDCISSGIIAFP